MAGDRASCLMTGKISHGLIGEDLESFLIYTSFMNVHSESAFLRYLQISRRKGKIIFASISIFHKIFKLKLNLSYQRNEITKRLMDILW